MPKLRTAIIVHGETPVNVIVLPPDPAEAAEYCENFDGICIVRDPEDEYGTELLHLTGCVAVEVTGMDPMPTVSPDWAYIDGQLVMVSEG